MKFVATLLAAFLLSGPAWSQDTSQAYRGKGSNAGGYANELNKASGAPLAKPAPSVRLQSDPAYRGKGSNAGGYANELNRPRAR